MSAVVCGNKRSFFEDLPATPNSSSPVSKKLRFSLPIQFSHFSQPPTPLQLLRGIFPHMDDQLLERALAECGNDLDSAIKSLHKLHLGSEEEILRSAEEVDAQIVNGKVTSAGETAPSEKPSASRNLPPDGTEWVELFVREMKSAASMDDARSRVTGLLEILEKSISARTGTEAAQDVHKENMSMKGQIESLIRDNAILKRAVAIQHERQKEYENRNQELQHLKQLLSQYQEQLKTLEMTNYALSMHLRQAQQSNSISGRFNPDVF